MKRFWVVFLLVFAGYIRAQPVTTTTYVGTVRDLTGATVTSGRITWTLNAPAGAAIPGSGSFVSTTVSCQISAAGSPVSSTDGTSPCVITNNTALTPTGTSYKMCTQPYNVSPGSCIVTYATGGTIDISTVVPTPTTGPFNFAGTPGPPGPANALAIGTVTKIPAGGAPTATITGTSPSQTLNMGLVTGDTGATGSTGATGPTGDTGPIGPPGGSLSYPGVTTDANNGLTVAGSLSAGGTITVTGKNLGAAAFMNTGAVSGTVAVGNDSRFLALTSGVPGFATQAALFANLNYAAGTVAYVGNDATLANNGNYIKNGVSGSGSWTQSLDRTSAVQAQVNKIQVSNLNTPNTNPDTATLLMTKFVTTGAWVTNPVTFCISDSPATFAGYVSSFSINLTGADAARTVRFYIATNNGSGSFTATYDSGATPMTVAGVNTYTLPDFTVAPVAVNQVMCAYINATGVSTQIQFFTSGGGGVQAAYSVASPMVAGTPITLTAQPISRWFPISAVVVDRDLYVAKRWADQPGGYPGITTSSIQIVPPPTGSIRPSVLPTYLRNGFMPETNSNSNLVSIFDASLPYNNANTANKVSLQSNSQTTTASSLTPCAGISDVSTYPSGTRLVFSFDSSLAIPGIPVTGSLSSCRIYPTTQATAGANIQAWVIRPPSGGFPTATGSQTYTFTVIAQIGELDDTTNGVYHEFSGLTLPVQAGDMLAFRVANRGLAYGSAGTPCNSMRELAFTSATIPSLADTSINGLTPGQVVSVTLGSNTRQYLYECTVLPGPSYAVGNQPGTVVRLDNNGNIPDSLGRSYDTYWKGKRAIWVGTSIPATNAGNTAISPYPIIVGQALQANMDNEAVGSSRITWSSAAPGNCLALMATQAQLTAAAGCGSVFNPQSFQAKVMGKHADLLVIDHGHNDLGAGSTISGALGDLAPITAYSSDGTTLTLTAANNFTAGLTVLFSAQSTDALAPLTQQTFTVLSTGLSTSQFAITTGLVAAGSGSSFATAANQATFYGAEQALIAAAYVDNPLMRIVLVMPPKNIDRGYVPPLDMTQVRAAISAIAQKWQLPVIDMAALDGFNDTNYCNPSAGTGYGGPSCVYSLDATHPNDKARTILARILYGAIKTYY